ncbi:unnamed protein product [Rotaria sp. Silwood2]|nr:unnamed protein product [Rotaria sp. Silwood2]CAF3032632.1 unnamed protein product [Rotaria sp. Silwood2]CAF3493256.1 unnamed protein product [Rotaria sp. Silwood2]CAF4371497.1 unnamed protein product [Rotaria sp. Silwood2]CAF4583559.1 unnamed protein product [Rotaria sp. Silwood2]
MMVPEKSRNVKRWEYLPNDVLLKEKILISFMERFYGPLQVNLKTIHVSLVRCLRNERSVKRKRHEESFTTNDNDKDSENFENMNETNDGDNFQTD